MAIWAIDKKNKKEAEIVKKDQSTCCTWKYDGLADEWKTDCGHTIKDDETSYNWPKCIYCQKEIWIEGDNLI